MTERKFFKISSVAITALALIFCVDNLLAPVVTKNKVERVTVESTGGDILGTGISYGEILYINNDRLRISTEAYYALYDSDSIFLETLPILRVTKKVFVTPDRKFYSYNIMNVHWVLALNIVLILLALRFKSVTAYIVGFNTIMFFIYLWLFYF